jgi:hypothetical protein
MNKFHKIEEYKKRKNLISTKEELIKNCFWIPERTPENRKEQLDKPSEYILYQFRSLHCPYNTEKHVIRLKEMIQLNVKKDNINDK